MNTKLKIRLSVISGTIVALLVVGGGIAWSLRGRQESTTPKANNTEKPDANPVSNIVELSRTKVRAAKLKTITVRRSDLQHTHTVPGRVTYDETLHVAVKTPADGVLTEVVVNPGDRVAAGTVLAWITSQEIGKARADVLNLQAQRELAVDWWKQKQSLAENVAKLAFDLEKRKPFATIRNEYATRVLGEYREKLFSAYSRFLLADALQKSMASLDQGIIAEKLAMQQASEQRASEAALRAACEQLQIDSRREMEVAHAAAVDAEKRLTIARQHLASLLLTPGMIHGTGATTGDLAGRGRDKDSDLQNLSRLAIRAPISGTIESRQYTAGERVKQSDSLFILAETSRLWIKADLRESDWNAMNLSVGQKLSVTSPAFPDKTFAAKLYQLGRTVSPETNSIPLIAEIDNREGKLRPGLFVRVTLPVTENRNSLFVPNSAVMQHDGESFVFVQIDEGRYRRTGIKTGIASDDRVEVLDGLHEGDRVVTDGAFVLKSELLLEREE